MGRRSREDGVVVDGNDEGAEGGVDNEGVQEEEKT